MSRSSFWPPTRARRATARISRSPRSSPACSASPPTTSSAAPSASAAARAACATASSPSLAILAVAATGSAVYAWQQLKTNEAFLNATLKRATEIVNTAVAQAEKYGVPRTATLALLTKAEGLFDDMARLGRPTPELRYQKAWMLIEFARNYAILGDTAKQKARAEEARQLMAELAAEMPDDPDETARPCLRRSMSRARCWWRKAISPRR